MQTDTPHRRHRHFVVAPLFALAILVPILLLVPKNGDDTEAFWSKAAGLIALPGGVGQSATGSTVDLASSIPSLEQGDMLVNARGVTRVALGNLQASALDGSFFASVRNGNVTVAALSSPVVITSMAKKFLIPIGMQWRSAGELVGQAIDQAKNKGTAAVKIAKELIPVPPTFLHDQLAKVSPEAASAVAKIDTGNVTGFSFLRLPEALKRLQAGKLLRFLSDAASAVASKNLARLQAALKQDAASAGSGSMLPAQLKHFFAASLLPAAANTPSALMEFIPFLQEPDEQLLVSTHPAYRSAAWGSMEAAPKDADTAFLRLTSLPATDTLPEAASSFTVEHWATEAKSFIASQTNPGKAAKDLIEAVVPSLTAAEKQGYPERVRRYASALESIAMSAKEAIPASLMQTLDGLSQLEPVPANDIPEQQAAHSATTPKPADTKQAESQSSSEASYSAAFIEDQLHSLLGSANALFTVKTQVKASGPHTAEVSGIIFSTPSGDHTYSFTFDVASQNLSDILRDEEKSLYGLSWDKFAAWVHGGR